MTKQFCQGASNKHELFADVVPHSAEQSHTKLLSKCWEKTVVKAKKIMAK